MNSNSLSSWTPTILAFAIPFVVASLLSLVTYWLSHHTQATIRRGHMLISIIMSLALLIVWVGIFVNVGYLPLLWFVFLITVVGASSLQTAIECAIGSGSLFFKSQFARSLFTYLSTSFIVSWVASCLIGYITSTIPYSSPSISPLDRNIAVISYGFMAGVLIAPISISFFRWMFQTLPMRPGIDRSMREEELVP